MRTTEALAILTSLRPEIENVSSELGTRGDAAFLRLEMVSDPARWAVVWSPGDRWFALDVNGGFSHNHVEEDTPDDEAQQIIGQLVGLAVQYILDPPTPVRSGRFGTFVIELSSGAGKVRLQKSLWGQLSDIFASATRFRR